MKSGPCSVGRVYVTDFVTDTHIHEELEAKHVRPGEETPSRPTVSSKLGSVHIEVSYIILCDALKKSLFACLFVTCLLLACYLGCLFVSSHRALVRACTRDLHWQRFVYVTSRSLCLTFVSGRFWLIYIYTDIDRYNMSSKVVRELRFDLTQTGQAKRCWAVGRAQLAAVGKGISKKLMWNIQKCVHATFGYLAMDQKKSPCSFFLLPIGLFFWEPFLARHFPPKFSTDDLIANNVTTCKSTNF